MSAPDSIYVDSNCFNLFDDSGITALVDLPVSNKTLSLSFENMKALTRVTLSCSGWGGCDISFAGTCLSREAYVEFPLLHFPLDQKALLLVLPY